MCSSCNVAIALVMPHMIVNGLPLTFYTALRKDIWHVNRGNLTNFDSSRVPVTHAEK